MKSARTTLVISALVSCALLVMSAALTRRICGEAFELYRERGGDKNFLSWFVRDLCGVPLPGVEPEKEEPTVKAKALENLNRQAELSRKIAKLEQLEREMKEKMAKALIADRQRAHRSQKALEKAAHSRKKSAKNGRSGGFVNTSGKSSYVAGNGKTPYRVGGIRGIEFGTTDNAPAEGVRPIMSVSYDADGQMKFNSLKWRENKKLTDSVYGFDRAFLSHTFETEQLSSVSFNKNFPFTDEGLRQAVEFYEQMSAEASADLGFEVVNVDRMGNNKSATICEFKNGDGETSIRGAISAWSDKSLTVTLSVSDNAYSKELRSQSRAAYDAGLAEKVNARIEVSPGDFTARKERINTYLDAH